MMVAAAMLSAKSYTVNLHMPAMFGGVELTPGEYKVEVTTESVIRNGKIHGETAVKWKRRYQVRNDYGADGEGRGQDKIQEIRIGGLR